MPSPIPLTLLLDARGDTLGVMPVDSEDVSH